MAKKINELDNISALSDTCVFITQDEGAETQVTTKVSLATLLAWLQDGHTFPINTATFLSGNGIDVSVNGDNITYSAKLGEGLEFDTNGNIAVISSSDTGDIYIHIRYADSEPTEDSDIKTEPSEYMGVYTGSSKTAPTTYTSYSWYKIKGDKGENGDKGDTGNGIANITKTSSTDNIDTYTTTFTNGRTTTFDVTNGVTTVTTSAIILTGTLSEDGWSDTLPYTQSVTLSELTTKSTPLLDLMVSDDVETGIMEEKQWLYITKATVSENNLTVQCYQEKPTIPLNFMVKVV